ncbi:MAG: STAS-like domain-containing protein [Polyangiaceae bacterium]|nr:STAS-like domain-containing protein [Myxococcales bacterium]MCB9585576.1 STAS-like domain-containing protein [Polyangiaceae bacterium]MCB9606409.1 STAS-like domain-containing protein [Polyangiaceae bacterium]
MATREESDQTLVRVRVTGRDDPVSRAEAKRLLAGVDRFKTVLMDFSNIEAIGQAFADQVFRVFQNEHPDIEIVPINTAPDVERMIARAKAHTP